MPTNEAPPLEAPPFFRNVTEAALTATFDCKDAGAVEGIGFLTRWLGVWLCLVLTTGWGAPADSPMRIELDGERFELTSPDDLEALSDFISWRLNESDRLKAVWERDVRQPSQSRLDDLTEAGLFLYHHPPEGVLSKKAERGWKAIAERVKRLGAAGPDRDSGLVQWEIRELAEAIENDAVSPIPKVGLNSLVLVLDQLQNTVGRGTTLASNVNECGEDDCICPTSASTFWEPTALDSTTDLYAGFGRHTLPDWSSRIWEYRKPKTSRGANPGFEIRSGPYEAKLKFAEIHSEPFAARMFHALGYHVDATDHVPGVKVRYDRRIFLEFNLRRELNLEISVVGFVSLWDVNLQEHHDPFESVQAAVLKNGERLDREAFRRRLVGQEAGREGKLLTPTDFDVALESEIDFILTVPANFQLETDDVKSVGPWRFDQLGHDDLREVRAVGLLAAWLGWFDTRYDNTRLRLVDGELRHYFSDVGGGLGRAGAAFNWKSESYEDFPWTFTEAPIVRGAGKMTTPFRVVNYHTVVDNEAFKAMTEDDARWMARRIGRLTREQLESALRASGYDAGMVKGYTEKLVNRRNRMLEDLGLADEFPPLTITDTIVIGTNSASLPAAD